jgi:hypothetical protein
MTAVLDFTAVDGLAFAAQRRRLPDRMPDLAVRDLGPVAELGEFAAAGLLPAPDRADWLRLDGLGPLYKAISKGWQEWICPEARRIGYLRTGAKPPVNPSIWTGFGLTAQQAAAASGFPSRIAAQLVAAIGEMRSNVYEHSGAPESSLVAFRATPHRFEFVVSDRGRGIVESFRRYGNYEHVNDYGEALRLMLTDGMSCHGANVGRGHGFRPLFIGLANVRGSLRFRSGDHALMIDGTNPTLMTAKVGQKPFLKGLLISVACESVSRRHA